LPGDAHPVAGFAHTTFEHVAHAELLRHLLHVESRRSRRQSRGYGGSSGAARAAECGWLRTGGEGSFA
jgi:hypothetical protein